MKKLIMLILIATLVLGVSLEVNAQEDNPMDVAVAFIANSGPEEGSANGLSLSARQWIGEVDFLDGLDGDYALGAKITRLMNNNSSLADLSAYLMLSTIVEVEASYNATEEFHLFGDETILNAGVGVYSTNITETVEEEGESYYGFTSYEERVNEEDSTDLGLRLGMENKFDLTDNFNLNLNSSVRLAKNLTGIDLGFSAQYKF